MNSRRFACRPRASDVDSPPMPPATDDRRPSPRGGPRALPRPADGRAQARERDPHPARAAQARPQGRARIDPRPAACSRRSTSRPPRSSTCCWRCPKYGRVKVNKVLTQCRISPSKTIGGLSRAPARRARLDAAPLAGSALQHRGARLRHHRPLRGRQGHADPRRCCERVPELELVGVGHHARAAAGRAATASTTTSSPTRSSTAGCATGDFVEHASYSGPPLRHAALRARAAHWPTARRSCSRSRSRARARSARRCPRRCRSSSPRRRWRRCARGWSAAAPTPPEQVEARLATAREELEAAGRVRPRRGQRPARAGVEELAEHRASASWSAR